MFIWYDVSLLTFISGISKLLLFAWHPVLHPVIRGTLYWDKPSAIFSDFHWRLIRNPEPMGHPIWVQFNRTISQMSQCTSEDTLLWTRNVNIFVPSDALWDMGQVHCGICKNAPVNSDECGPVRLGLTYSMAEVYLSMCCIHVLCKMILIMVINDDIDTAHRMTVTDHGMWIIATPVISTPSFGGSNTFLYDSVFGLTKYIPIDKDTFFIWCQPIYGNRVIYTNRTRDVTYKI